MRNRPYLSSAQVLKSVRGSEEDFKAPQTRLGVLRCGGGCGEWLPAASFKAKQRQASEDRRHCLACVAQQAKQQQEQQRRATSEQQHVLLVAVVDELESVYGSHCCWSRNLASAARVFFSVCVRSTPLVCGSYVHSRRRTLLTGFAMRSDPKGFSEVSAPLTAEAQALGARTLRPGSGSY